MLRGLLPAATSLVAQPITLFVICADSPLRICHSFMLEALAWQPPSSGCEFFFPVAGFHIMEVGEVGTATRCTVAYTAFMSPPLPPPPIHFPSVKVRVSKP